MDTQLHSYIRTKKHLSTDLTRLRKRHLPTLKLQPQILTTETHRHRHGFQNVSPLPVFSGSAASGSEDAGAARTARSAAHAACPVHVQTFEAYFRELHSRNGHGLWLKVLVRLLPEKL